MWIKIRVKERDIDTMDTETFEYLSSLSDNQLKEIMRGGVEDSDDARAMLRERRRLRGELK